MPKEEAIEVEGDVVEALANTQFRVKLKNGHTVMAHVAGKMRKHFIRLRCRPTTSIAVVSCSANAELCPPTPTRSVSKAVSFDRSPNPSSPSPVLAYASG